MKVVLALAGALGGAIALSVLTVLFHWIFFRFALQDGQYAFVLFVTIPIGALLGMMTALSMTNLSRHQTGSARFIAVGGGGFLVVLLLLLGFFVFSGTENPSLLDRLSATLFWFGLPLAWAGLLLGSGLRTSANR